MAAVLCEVCLDSFGKSAEAVDDTVLGRQGWASQCWVLEDNCVVDGYFLRGVFDDFVALVVFEQRAYVESGAASEIPRALGGPPIMRDDLAAWWPHWGGVEVVESF
jgi:hypothetical protein